MAVVEPRGRQAAARKVAAQLEAAPAPAPASATELAAAVRRQAAVAMALLAFGLLLVTRLPDGKI